MRLKIIMLVSLIAICGAADALEFTEEISVAGNGSLSARTTTDTAKDGVNGTGEQDYTRNLNLQENAATLTSEYHLTSNLQEKTNRYYAQMNSPTGLEHSIWVNSASDINSISTITRSDDLVSTDYDVETNMADMTESITSWYDSSEGKTGNKIAETEIHGNLSIKSQLTDDGEMVDKPIGFSPDEMLEMLEAVDMTTVVGRVDNKISTTNIYEDDELVDQTVAKGEVIYTDDDEEFILGTVIDVPETAEKDEICLNGTGIKEIDGRRIAFIGHRSRTPLGWGQC